MSPEPDQAVPAGVGEVSASASGRAEAACAGADEEADADAYLRLLLREGVDVPAHTQGPPPTEAPPWLDEEKFRRGQRFATEHLFGLAYSEMLSLIILFSFPSSLEPLIFTGNSDTPFKAFKRYLSTGFRVLAWFEGDVWGGGGGGEARRQVGTVRAMHEAVQRRLGATPAPERERRSHVAGPLWAPLTTAGMLGGGAGGGGGGCPCLRAGVDVNQTEMALTQFGFVGLMLLHPDRLGAPDASERDLEGFAHMWRGLGYLLGIEDRFNLCSGDLNSVRRRCQLVVERLVAPSMERVTAEWEHMSRCMVAGVALYVPGPPFSVSLCYLLGELLALREPAARLRAALCLGDRLTLLFVGGLLRWLLRFAPLRRLYNWLLRLAMKRARHAPQHWLSAAETRRYPYQQPAITQL
ncbi:uncharacterized protein LOC126199211 [Schistocerca nitens]|uniref:uncharacterized protein LOC126199211 n=1 Tax=Schistocerca nitens TaxID=7011 RepID=UPI00211949B7|nr:uncharacterized protein LOC126199211 [Schistocerca nitens]